MESTTTTDVQEQSTDAQEQATDVQEPPPKKLYKVKVDGQEIEVDEDELLRGYTHRKAADKRFQEASQARKQAEQFVHMLRTDPIKVLTHPSLGIEFRKLAEDYLLQQLEEESLDPKERELRDYKRKLEAIEQQQREQREREEQERLAQLREHYTQDYSQKIIQALSTSGLPQTPHTVRRMAYYMHEGLKRGFDLTPADVVDLVKKDYIEETKSLYGALDSDVLLQLLGDDVASKIRKADLARLKSTPKPIITHVSAPKSSSAPAKKLTKDEWRDLLKRRVEE